MIGEVLAEHVVPRVQQYLVQGEAAGQPALDERILVRAAALLDLEDVVPERRLHRIGHLPDLERLRGGLVRLDEPTLAGPADLATRAPRARVLRPPPEG